MEILVVDDDAVVLKSCTRILQVSHKDWNITTVSSVKEAYQSLSRTEFSVLIVDIMMPEENGYMLIEKAKSWDPKVLILAMSGYPTAEIIKKSKESGAEDFIPKPFNPDELTEAVEKLIQGGGNEEV